MKIDWKKDYQGEFICPRCCHPTVRLGGFNREKRQLYCKDCKCHLQISISLNKRSYYLESRLKDEGIDWGSDYKDEFICPKCQSLGMTAWGTHKAAKKDISSVLVAGKLN